MGIEREIATLASAFDAVVVTPSDSTVLSGVRALWVGTGGNLTLSFPSGDIVVKNVASGQLLPVRPSKVKAATTAADIVAFT
ncbi:spike base protein, RCAP_Rcc01079 family [Bradyrhizobium sp.]|uniref:spike base protein, RCAP_Rcc01079 family n=1 Tax=Bradyrhizobium sp. TaxID=376 RepID=UPI0039E61874